MHAWNTPHDPYPSIYGKSTLLKYVNQASYRYIMNYSYEILLSTQIFGNLIDLSPYMNIMYLPNKYITGSHEHKTFTEYGNTYI